MGRKTKLSSELQAKICGYIRAGAYDWVAAQACGIDPATFRRWMHAGGQGSPLYAEFCAEVMRAKTEARVVAENAVFKNAPFNWLRFGPGRERPGEPGWTQSQEVTGPEGGPIELVIVERVVDAADPEGSLPDEASG
jgi:1,6-anhydro-N-acetylmuramate kinase